jgi:hypothetical protein
LGLDRLCHAVRLYEGNDHIFAHSGACHRDHIRDCDRSGRGRATNSGFDLRTVSGFDFVEAAADRGAAKGTNAGANRSSRSRVADSVTDDRA